MKHVGQDVQPVHQIELLENHGGMDAPGAQVLAAQQGHVGPVAQDVPRSARQAG